MGDLCIFGGGSLSLVGGGQTSGSVDSQVGGLGELHQGDVVTVAAGLIVPGSQHDEGDVEILHNQSLGQSVQLVFTQPD